MPRLKYYNNETNQWEYADNVAGGNVKDGFSPIAKVEQTATGAVVSITDKTGTTTATITNGKDGEDYVLTPDDKTEIAEMAAELVDVPEGSGVHIGTDEPTDGSTVWIDTDEEPETPSAGEPGKDGKSAYEYAKEGGYTVTEEEFAAKMAMEIPEAVPSDWNAAEGQPGHVLNRTHWTEQGHIVIAPEQTAEVNEDAGGIVISANRELVADTEYLVHWDGVTYESTAIEAEPGLVVLGNLAFLDPELSDTGEPFIVLQHAETGLMAMSESTSVTVCITSLGEGEVVHRLPDKFLPIYTLVHVLTDMTVSELFHSNGLSCDFTFAITNECKDILLQGGQVRLKIIDSVSNDFAFLNITSWFYVDGYVYVRAIHNADQKFAFNEPFPWLPNTV